jgi:hypothetical protein
MTSISIRSLAGSETAWIRRTIIYSTSRGSCKQRRCRAKSLLSRRQQVGHFCFCGRFSIAVHSLFKLNVHTRKPLDLGFKPIDITALLVARTIRYCCCYTPRISSSFIFHYSHKCSFLNQCTKSISTSSVSSTSPTLTGKKH